MSDELLLFGAAAAVRLLLSTVFPALPDLLGGRVEVSTPVTSFKRCTHTNAREEDTLTVE
jgi:phosphatidylinositol glycan class U